MGNFKDKNKQLAQDFSCGKKFKKSRFGILVRDIVPPNKFRQVVLGWQKKASLKARFWSMGWRLFVFFFVLLWVIAGISPLEFFYRTIWAEKTRLATISFYANSAQGDWQNPDYAQGVPEAGEDKKNYQPSNSAIYLGGGKKELILTKFLPAAGGRKQIALQTKPPTKTFAPVLPAQNKANNQPCSSQAASSSLLGGFAASSTTEGQTASSSTKQLDNQPNFTSSSSLPNSRSASTTPSTSELEKKSNSFNFFKQSLPNSSTSSSSFDKPKKQTIFKDKNSTESGEKQEQDIKPENVLPDKDSQSTTSISWLKQIFKNNLKAFLPPNSQAQTELGSDFGLEKAYQEQYGKFLRAQIKISLQIIKSTKTKYPQIKYSTTSPSVSATTSPSVLATSSSPLSATSSNEHKDGETYPFPAQATSTNLDKPASNQPSQGQEDNKSNQAEIESTENKSSSTLDKDLGSTSTKRFLSSSTPASAPASSTSSSLWEKIKSWLWPFGNKVQAQTATTSAPTLFSLWYSFDGQFWQKVNVFYAKQQAGQITLPALFLDSWDKLTKLQFKVVGEEVGYEYKVYLDSIWVEAQYELKTEKVQNKNSDVLEIDGRLIKFVYTDNNQDENLIIKTSQKTYTGLSRTQVYFSVTNTTNRSEQVNIQVHFPAEKGKVENIELLAQGIPALVSVPRYGSSTFECASGWQKRIKIAGGEQAVYYECASSKIKKHCDSLSADKQKCYVDNVLIGQEQRIRYKDKWQKVPLQARRLADKRSFLKKLLGLGPKRKSLPPQFAPKASTASDGYIIMPGQTQYFRMTIKFPIASQGEFFIEAIGDNSGYGLLDPWWSSSWSYRLPITIDNSSSSNTLTEYQIYLEISSTTQSFWRHVKSDGGDIRFLSSDQSTELNYWIQYWDYTASSAAIWVQVDEIPATSTTKIYMYYGNSSATTTSNMYGTFTYSNLTPIFYVVNNDLSGASLKVVSLIDNNSIQLDSGTPVSLDRQEITTFTTFSATSVIKAKGPVHAKIADEENADALVPIAFASRQFTVPSTRGSELFYLYAPFATTTIDLYDSGTKITAQTKTIGPGQATTTSYNIGTMAIVEATVPVLLSFENDTPADAIAPYPTTDRDLYGVRSNYNYIGVASNTTNFIIYCSGGASTTVTNQARGTNYSNTTCTSANEGNGDMVRIANINRISLGAIQQADSDGYESTVYLPAKEFSTEYMVPTDAAYITVACAPKGGTVNLSIYDENNTFVTSGTCSPSGELPGKAYFGTGDTATYLAGSRIVSTNGVPFYAYYEDVTAPGAAGGGDENNLWGATQFRKFSYPSPSVTIGSEEPLSPPEGSFVSAVQKADGSGRVDISISVMDASHDECKAKIEFATGTTCNFTSPGDPTLDETDANIAATYGDPDIDNNFPYQVGTTTGWITTLYGTNTVQFDWLTKIDLPTADGTYCLRLTVNDGIFDQATSATTTLIVDNAAPTVPGDLSFVSKTGSSVTLGFGATSTETHFREYKIYYKTADGTAPTESDSVWASTSDVNLADQNFNGATTTTISGLTKGITYSFAIWAYDNYGNRASSSWINVTANNEPTGSFNTAAQKTNGSGRVDISIEVDDANNDDTCRAKIEFATGTTCNFASAGDPTLDEISANIQADFGSPVIDNKQIYQVGSSTGWILTSPGSNTIQFDWLTATDLPTADGTYCLRLTVNDGIDDQLTSATTTLTLDNVSPTAPGSLAEGGTTLTTITLLFATSTPSGDTNEPTLNAYRIFYKIGTSSVTEADTEHDDAALNAYDYNGATSTTVTGLNSNTWYVFNIWAYDSFGNKASATEVAIKTKASLSNDSLTFVNAQTIGTTTNVAVADNSTEWTFRVVVTETNGWYAIASTTLRLADASDNSSPFKDLEFYWDQTANEFYEIGTDAQGAATLANTSTSTCSDNTCTLDFKIIFNKNFSAPATPYTAQVYSINDSGTTDTDNYTDFYQVRFPYLEQIHYRWRNDDGGE